jgi:nucleoside-diphosphate-sugar epimerase
MLRGEKILVTGPAGQIAFPLCEALATDNDVWGIARFSEPGSRERVEALGVTTRVVDLGVGDLGDLPTDFTCVLHLAAYLSPGDDFDAALRVNAEGTGLLFGHVRRPRAVLVMSTGSVYRPHDDAWHAYTETDPLGDGRLAVVPTYSITKIGQEAVARTCARLFDTPTIIVRMNAAYGPNGGMVAHHLDAVVQRRPVRLRWDPNPYSIIHQDDVNAQVEALLGAAAVPAPIVNWGGDDPVTMQDACAFLGELTGRSPDVITTEAPGTHRGVVVDTTRRRALTGPCRVGWRDGLRSLVAARYPDGPDGPRSAGGPAARAMAERDGVEP